PKWGRGAILRLGVSRWPRTNKAVVKGRWSVHRGRPALVVITKRTHYQVHAIWQKPIRKAGPMKLESRSVACDGAGQPRGRMQFSTWTDAKVQEVVPSSI